ncbi:alpha/beta hydrolase [Nocardioides sp. CPCC 205120]|uniref:alpha/beta hydrolase n=1 Tax=Nocardioides sp. CPCC 205120 TaxID=3406462 RepID=UPI003B5075D3
MTHVTPPAPDGDDALELAGHAGTLAGRRWSGPDPSYVVLLCHGYGEHVGRYTWVAERLVADGAVAYGVDHRGHGRSAGERVLVPDFEAVVDDVHLLEQAARADHPGLPVVLLGHSMGGMIAARYAQRHGDGLACVVLSGPVLGRWEAAEALLDLPEIPDVPIDPATLSRDPAVGEAYVADPLVWHGPFKRTTVAALVAFLGTITAAGPVTSTPLLHLHGAEDALVPVALSRAGFAAIAAPGGSESREYPGARHEILNETNRDEVLADVLEFVHRHL